MTAANSMTAANIMTAANSMTAASKYKVCVIPSPTRGYTLQGTNLQILYFKQTVESLNKSALKKFLDLYFANL